MYGWGIIGRGQVQGLDRTGGAADSRLIQEEQVSFLPQFDPVMFSRAHHVVAATRDAVPADDPLVLLGQPVVKAPIVINSSGPPAVILAPTDDGFFSSLPWWAWLAGAGVGWYALKGKGR